MINIPSLCTFYFLCAGTRHCINGIKCHLPRLKFRAYISSHDKFQRYKRAYSNFTKVKDCNLLKMDTNELKDCLLNNKLNCENLLKRRFFYINSFEIYGGSAGFFDYGPPGSALQDEILRLWREHFIYFDEMLQMTCSSITPFNVLKASGHVDRFTDLMIKDLKTGDCYRADKYIEDLLDSEIKCRSNNGPLKDMTIDELRRLSSSIPCFSSDDIKDFILKYEIKSPDGNEFSEPFPFNLMFSTCIGPKHDNTSLAYLRPETAQGIFVNFNRLLEYNGGKIPFAAAQIGLGFRNEISPRNGLLRVREFLMGEIEYFVNPNNKTHDKYNDFKHLIIPLLPNTLQEEGKSDIQNTTIENAVDNKIINNEALGYFLARTYLFLMKCGINPNGIRFRQHTKNEMAHYASDCWDAEILTSYGWIETVGHADRMAYDLMCHSKSTGTKLVANVRFDEPITVRRVVPNYNKPLIGKTFKNHRQVIFDYIESLNDDEKWKLEEALQEYGYVDLRSVLNIEGREMTRDVTTFQLTREMVKFESIETKMCEDVFVPAVIEPSFGIGRLMYAILEHSYRVRPIEQNMQEERSYIALKPDIAPIKCCILPLSSKEVFNLYINKVQDELNKLSISYKIDKTGAFIGKRYARNDEIGIPYAVTIDFQTVKDDTVTLRERDTMEQIRLKIDDVKNVLSILLNGRKEWESLKQQYPLFTQQDL